MTRSEFLVFAGGALLPVNRTGLLHAGTSRAATVLYGGHTVEIDRVMPDNKDLWVTADDLKRINGFELKPQGACLDEVCIPIQKDGRALVRKSGGQSWFNLSGFARKIKEAYIADEGTHVWSFGEIPELRGGFLNSRIAPDFALPDRKGNTVQLSDFRGKKVLLLTWASW